MPPPMFKDIWERERRGGDEKAMWKKRGMGRRRRGRSREPGGGIARYPKGGRRNRGRASFCLRHSAFSQTAFAKLPW